MPTTLDKWLNVLVPLGIFLIFGAIFYQKLKDPIDRIVAWIKGIAGYGVEKISEGVSGASEKKVITYE